MTKHNHNHKQQQPKHRYLRKILYGLLILVALLMIFHVQLAHFVLSQFQPTINQTTIQKAKKAPKKANYDWKKVKPLTAEQVINARLQAGKINFIGMVSVPAIGLSVPISHGTDDINLSLGAGTLYENERMGQGNYALASHFIQGESGKRLLFSPLYYQGKVGQKIYLTDMDKVYTYRATTYRTIKPTDVQWADPVAGKKLITLITCDYTAERGRVIMQGTLEKQQSWDKTPASIQKSFTKDNRWIK